MRLTALGAALAVAGAVHAAVNQRALRRARPVADLPPVSVLVPARDETATIDACLTALGAQDVAAELVVVDDLSSDDTAARARGHGARVVDGVAPPAGWLGKPWALQQAAAVATGEVFVLVDADVRVLPGALRAAVGELVAGGYDVVTGHPRQLTGTVAERLVQPLLLWSVLVTLPLHAAERSPRPSLAAANGQFLVIRAQMLARVGGFVPDAVLDDLALVRAVKRAGGRVAFVDAAELAECRMYTSWLQVRDGYGKSLWAAFGSPAGAVPVVGLLVLTYVVPPLAMLRGSRLGAVGYAAGVASRVISARRARSRVWPDSLAHPASIGLFAWLTARSVREHRRGTTSWKGRAV
ncbi:MAG: glycosyltransferase [Jatrophihabitans sp.]|uniref:glycosyltransferase n=1 Tax=Jatrophihabitans sp. TaxID=1932789 RepID=UPI003F7DC04A